MFLICDNILDRQRYQHKLINENYNQTKAVEGSIRNCSETEDISIFLYEIFKANEERETLTIIKETQKRFDVKEVVCVQKVGSLRFGELAFWVGVSGGDHRESLAACQYVIQEIRKRLPVWTRFDREHQKDTWIDSYQDING